MSSGLNSWFNNGQPVGTPTNDLNAMRWASANGLKDVIAEADKEGVVKGALDKQHAAIQTEPVVSAQALKTAPKLRPRSPRMIVWNGLRDLYTKATGGLTESMKMQDIRNQLGPYQLPNIENPPAPAPIVRSSVTPPVINTPLPKTPTAQPFPLPEDIITKAIAGKGPAQAERLVRDMRYNQGNWNPLKAQQAILEAITKRKYQ